MIHIRNLSKETEFIFALSSGVDSVAACHLLWRRGYKFSIAHFHHNAQAINDNMVEAASSLARELKVPIYIGYNKDKIGDKNIEDECRQKRLEFFRKFNKNIILAQHLDDACESFFVNAMLGGNTVPGKKISPNGYVKMANGLILQWGYIAAGANGDVSTTFPLVFPNACFNVVNASYNEKDGGTYDSVVQAISTSAVQFNRYAGVGALGIYWLAIGY